MNKTDLPSTAPLPNQLQKPSRIRRTGDFLASLWLPAAICALSGVALAFAYPTWNVGWLVWVALAPALASLWLLIPHHGKSRLVAASICGWAMGAGFFLTNVFWITEVSALGWLCVALYLALYPAAWAVVASTVGRPRLGLYAPQGASSDSGSWLGRMFSSSADSIRVGLVNASTWTALEWIRSWMFTGFGWNGLGVALHENHVLIQIADIVGVTGLSFFVMLAISIGTTTVYRIILEVRYARIRPHADFFAVLAVFVGLFFYGTRRMQEIADAEKRPETESLQCLVIQPNIPQDKKWDNFYADDILAQLIQDTETGNVDGLDLVIWPETAVPFVLQTQKAQEIVDGVLALGNFSFISGFNDYQSETELYNALAMFHGDYFNARLYRKTHLVPFGEFIPFRDTFPPFEWIAGTQITDDYSRGNDTSPIPIVSGSPSQPEIIPLICFEDTVGSLVRKFRSPQSQIMVTITNNGWFGESANAHQHMANAKFRCIEMRRPMLRAANTGVSCHIGPAGDIRFHVHDPDSGSTFVRSALLADVKIAPQATSTFFARHGDLFSKVLGFLALAFIALSSFKAKLSQQRNP